MYPFRIITAAVVLTLPAMAQIPSTLLHPIPAPPVGVQAGAGLGYSVATDGGLSVLGAPFDNTAGDQSGVVKVLDSATGALLHLLINPSPVDTWFFGYSVAIFGTRVVVGATYRNPTEALGTGRAYVYDLAGTTPAIPVAELDNPAPSEHDYFGYALAISGTRVVVGAYGDNAGAENAGSAYVYELTSATPTVPVVTLNNPSPSVSDNFGHAVAISGTWVGIGAPYDDGGGSDAGSAFVYDLTSATPNAPLVTLNNPSPVFSDSFGYSVAVSGTRVVVGAYQDDTGAENAGSAYIYDVASATPAVPVITLHNPSPAAGDEFAFSVAISGARIVVGTHQDNTGASNAGSAYIYNLDGASPLVPVATLNNPTPAADDYFGNAVAISGTQTVIGAYLDDTGATGAGSAYVYELASPNPAVPVRTLSHLSPSAGDIFGASVAVSGTRLVVGSPFAASAYVYDLASTTPTVPMLTLQSPSQSPGDLFGESVAISGMRVVVGASKDDTGASDAGRVYVYDLTGVPPLVPIVSLDNPSPAQGDQFGMSVSISGARVVVGTPYGDTGASSAGSAYVYDLAGTTPTVPVAVLHNPEPAVDDRFGWSVAISGTRVMVGAFLDDSGAIDAGSAYVYALDGAAPTVPSITLHNPSPTATDKFGHAVAISGTRMVVGATLDDTGGKNSGSAYVYDLDSPTPASPMMTFNNPSPEEYDYFGSAVAISGARVIVGASGDKTGAPYSGSAYVYDISVATPTVPIATLVNPSPGNEDIFGAAVAIDGMTVAVGAPYDDTVASFKGYAYVFGPADADTDDDGLLDIWEFAHFGTIAGHSSQDDFDNDGTSELLEQAFDLDPTLGIAGAANSVINEGGYLTITIPKRAGVTYEVQSAGSLLPSQPDSFSAASTTVLTNNATTLKVRDNFLIGSSPPRFMRVKVTASP